MVLGAQALHQVCAGVRKSGAPPLERDSADARHHDASLFRAVETGFATNTLNPKIALFYLAAFPAFVGVSSPPGEAFVLVSIHAAVAVAWFSAVALLCARIVGAFSAGALSSAVTALSGMVLLGLGVGVVTS